MTQSSHLSCTQFFPECEHVTLSGAFVPRRNGRWLIVINQPPDVTRWPPSSLVSSPRSHPGNPRCIWLSGLPSFLQFGMTPWPSHVAHDLGSLREDAPNLDLPDIFLAITLGVQSSSFHPDTPPPLGEKLSKIIERNFMPLPKATEKSPTLTRP